MVSVRALGTVVALAVAAVTAAAMPASAATPAANVLTPVDYWQSCSTDPTATACYDAVLADIDYARGLEGVGPMVLPADFATLDAGRQAFVVTNLERVDRGLQPMVGLSIDLDALAGTAATAHTDPVFAQSLVGPMQGLWWTGIWADTPNPLIADLLWMYQDGYGGTDTTNMDCTAAGSAGCWGHRANILSDYSGAAEIVAGAGSADGGQSVAEVAVGGTGALPALDYRWTDALAAGAGGPAAMAAWLAAQPPAVVRVTPAAAVAHSAAKPARKHRPHHKARARAHTRTRARSRSSGTSRARATT